MDSPKLPSRPLSSSLSDLPRRSSIGGRFTKPPTSNLRPRRLSTTPPRPPPHHDSHDSYRRSSVNEDDFPDSPVSRQAPLPSNNVAPNNPLVPDRGSQWVQGSDGLDDFLKKIRPVGGEEGGAGNNAVPLEEEEEGYSSEFDDSTSEEEEDEWEDSFEGYETGDSRMFEEEEEEDGEDSSMDDGSRVSKAVNPLTADVVRMRAAKDLDVLASLVPARVLFSHAYGLRPKGPMRPMREEFDGAVLFADISGFSRLAEHLVRRQTPSYAAESLTKYVGLNLHEMVEVICSKGGDVMKFAGDAILAVFAADEFGGSLPKAAVCCAQAALQLQTLELSAGEAKLFVHSGMGCGRVATYEVGGLQDRWEVFVAGPPVEQIGRCEPQAKPGELVVSAEARKCIEEICRVRGAMVEDGNFRLDALMDHVEFPERVSVAKEVAAMAMEDPDRAMELKRVLQKYLSRPVIFSIEGQGQTLWGAELRVCSTLFCKFKGLRFTETSDEDLALVQHVVKNVVQKIMADLEGTVCRFMVDDKGAAMLLAFGLIPFCHANDSSRAVKAALMIRDGVAALSLLDKNKIVPRKEDDFSLVGGASSSGVNVVDASMSYSSTAMSHDNIVSPDVSHMTGTPRRHISGDLFNFVDQTGSGSAAAKPFGRKRSSSKHRVPLDSNTRTILKNDHLTAVPRAPVSCQIGITRGKVCVGMVGGSTRCEYTLHGVLVNRAARLMGNATDAVILCDQETYLEARNDIEFDPTPVTLRLKGERKQVKVFKPIRKAHLSAKRGPTFSYTKDSKKAPSTASQFGTGDVVNMTRDEDDELGFIGREKEKNETEQVFDLLVGESPWCGVVGIQGDSGIGKSRLLQYVTHRARSGGRKIVPLTGFALDTELSTSFFAWKSIVYQIVSQTRLTPSSHLHSAGSKESVLSSPSAARAKKLVINRRTTSSHDVIKKHDSNGGVGGGVAFPMYRQSSAGGGNGVGGVGISKGNLRKHGSSANVHALSTASSSGGSPLTLITSGGEGDEEKFGGASITPPRTGGVTPAGSRLNVLTYQSSSTPSTPTPRDRVFEEMSPDERKECLIEALPLDKRELYPLFATFMEESIPASMMSDNVTTSGIVREQRMSATIDAIVAMVTNFAAKLQVRGERLAIFMEDLQWLDPASLETLNTVSKSIPRLAVFVSGSFSHAQGITSRIRCDRLWDLAPLEKSEIARCMELWVNVPKVSDAAVDLIFERTTGNPLFAEELCRLMKEKHSFEITNDVCMLKATSDDSRQELPNSITALMTQSLDRLDAAQQIVLRVASVMGMQFTLHDLAGVFRAINKASTAKLFESDKVVEFDVDDKEMTLEEMLRAAKEPALQLHPAPSEIAEATGREDFVSIKIDVNSVLKSLVNAGILLEPNTQRRTFIFRHAMMKETACEELLRLESKQALHEIIANYYEERPGVDLAQWHMILADHFFLADNVKKAFQYLELAGEAADQNHSVDKMHLCYLRLLKLLASSQEDIPLLKRAQWSRKVGAALFYMDRTTDAEDYLHRALEILSLDCRDAPPMSGAEAGFFPQSRFPSLFRSRDAATGEEFVALEPRPSKLKQALNQCFYGKSGLDNEYAEDFVNFVDDDEGDVQNLSMGGFHLGGQSSAEHGSGSANSMTTKKASMRGVGGGGASHVNKLQMLRTRSMSLAELAAPLRPRLLLGLLSFKQLKETALTVGDEKNEAVDILLEAALVYDFLGKLLRDRGSSVALERRLNAILLSESAVMSFSPIKKRSMVPFVDRPRLSGLPPSSNMLQSADYTSGEYAMAGDNSLNSNLLYPSLVSPLEQRAMDELSRSYSRASVFFAGMHPGTKWRTLGSYYSHKANGFLKNKSVFRSDLAQHSENRVLLHQRCGEYDAIQGNFIEASQNLRFAVWGARFMHLDRVRIETQILELTVFFFNGDLDNGNTVACELFEKNSKPGNMALGARFMALCGVHDVALHRLKSLARSYGSNTMDDLTGLEKGLESLSDPNAWLTLSFVAWRGPTRNGKLAIKAAIMAAESFFSSELSDAPLSMFHVVALCFTAIWDPLRDSDVPLVEDVKEHRIVEEILKKLIKVVRSYAIVYRVCRAHALYCIALRPLILQKLELFRSKPAEAGRSSHEAPNASVSCWSAMILPSETDPFKGNLFVECARLASETQAYWVQGLALLEIPDQEAWRESFVLFSNYNHTEYELSRCETLLKDSGVDLGLQNDRTEEEFEKVTGDL